MKVAVVGATGLVGTKMLQVLEERNFPVTELIPVASEKSIGKEITFKGKQYKIVSAKDAISKKPDLAIFSAGGSTSLELAPQFAEVGTTVVDNSSAWRMDPTKKLVVPEVNADVLTPEDKIIANPNCSTIQMVVTLKPLHDRYKIKRVVVSTYQSVTGTGVKAVDQLFNERKGIDGPQAYPYHSDDEMYFCGYWGLYRYALNDTLKADFKKAIIDHWQSERPEKEGLWNIMTALTGTKDFDLNEVRDILSKAPGIIVTDDVANLKYPMPLDAHDKDEVFVGRLRRDESQPNTLNAWIVADNLRKGAATNAVQIAEYLAAKNLIGQSVEV